MNRQINRPDLTPVQEQAFQTICNLRQLTLETGSFTTRSQNAILRSMTDADLAAVANALAWLSESNPTVAVQSGKPEGDDGNLK
jgi:hypothetical protein